MYGTTPVTVETSRWFLKFGLKVKIPLARGRIAQLVAHIKCVEQWRQVSTLFIGHKLDEKFDAIFVRRGRDGVGSLNAFSSDGAVLPGLESVSLPASRPTSASGPQSTHAAPVYLSQPASALRRALLAVVNGTHPPVHYLFSLSLSPLMAEGFEGVKVPCPPGRGLG